jgi:hypothetical protein
MQSFCISQYGDADSLHLFFTDREPPGYQPVLLILRKLGQPLPIDPPAKPDPRAILPSPIPKAPLKQSRAKSTPSKPRSGRKSIS